MDTTKRVPGDVVLPRDEDLRCFFGRPLLDFPWHKMPVAASFMKRCPTSLGISRQRTLSDNGEAGGRDLPSAVRVRFETVGQYA
jgi:hypothetical protein